MTIDPIPTPDDLTKPALLASAGLFWRGSVETGPAHGSSRAEVASIRPREQPRG